MYRSIIAVFLFAALAGSCKKECEVCEECEVDVCASADLAKGLLAYYPFNGNANDESGNGNNAVAMNGAHLGPDMVGRPQRAAEFDGTDDYFLVNDNGKLSTDSVSVAMAVMVTNTNRRHSFITRGKFEDATGVSWGLGQSLAETNVFDFVVKDKAEACTQAHVYDPNTLVSTPEQMVAGRWYHVVMTFARGKQKLFIDGQLRSSKDRAFQDLKKCNAANLIIGGWWKNDIISVAGRIDNIRIYNRIITDCEIKELTKAFE